MARVRPHASHRPSWTAEHQLGQRFTCATKRTRIPSRRAHDVCDTEATEVTEATEKAKRGVPRNSFLTPRQLAPPHVEPGLSGPVSAVRPPTTLTRQASLRSARHPLPRRFAGGRGDARARRTSRTGAARPPGARDALADLRLSSPRRRSHRPTRAPQLNRRERRRSPA